MTDTHPAAVPRDQVVRVLRLHGVDVTCRDSMYTLAKGDVVDAQALPQQVTRHLLGRFASKFDFSMGDFFAPRHVGDEQDHPGLEKQPER